MTLLLLVLGVNAASLDDLTYTTTDGKVTITDCDETAAGELVIPPVIEGNPVTRIGNNAFNSCLRLTSINIPNSVNNIGDRAFYSCGQLSSINIPERINRIREDTFSFCKALKSITIPETVVAIEEEAFGWSGLESVIIPERVTRIERRVFYNCDRLESVTIPESVITIDRDAFRNSGNLKTITFLGLAPIVGNLAFSGLSEELRAFVKIENANSFGGIGSYWEGLRVVDESQLTALDIFNWENNADGVTITRCITAATGEVVIPATIGESPVTRIEDSAFYECSSVTGITIPNSVITIGSSAFYDCTALTAMAIPNSVKTIGTDSFFGCPITNLEIPDRFSSSLAYLGFSPQLSHQKLLESIASNEVAPAAVAANTAEISKIKDQLAILVDALAQKDVEIAEKNERIALLENAKDERIAFLEEAKVADVVRNLLDEKDDEIAILEQRPTQTEFNAVITERDARPTPEEIQDARTGSVILTPSEDGTVKLKLEIEESADLEVWSNEGKKLEALILLAEGKKFLRFALAAQD
ncbi:leucine-rich repeat protein [Akkermansiaceae bacterium]|nr:leucine-rich repeat protein [Akkermansiaceae bacterium]